MSDKALIRFAVGCCLLLGLLAGCAPQQKAAELDDAAQPAGPEQLRLLVIDDPGLAAAVERLRAEWQARTGSRLEIAESSVDEVLSAERLPETPDAVIYPSRLLGTLVERGWIGPLPADFASHRDLAWTDTFELLQVAETQWSGEAHAVPLGSPLLTCYLRADLLQRQHKTAPRSWEEYHKLASTLGRRENLGEAAPATEQPWHGSLQPLAAGWAGRVLLARAAPYARHRDLYSTLFDIETMEPLVATAAFERALQELIADAELGPPEQITMDVDEVREAFLAGRAAMALAWPGHSDAARGEPPPQVAVEFAELPGSPVVYHFAHQSWEKRQSDQAWQVPLLGLAGRLGSVASQAAHGNDGFQLLAWLSGREWGTRVSSASRATTLYRRSQVRSPQPWVDAGTDAAAAQQYAAGVQQSLERRLALSAPRIPGEAEYMRALDTAVHSVLRQENSVAESLQEAAKAWNRITDRLGRDTQKAAYRRSLGL